MAKSEGQSLVSGPLNCFALLPEMTTMEQRTKFGEKMRQRLRELALRITQPMTWEEEGEAASAGLRGEREHGLVGHRIHLCRNITLICIRT